MVCRRIGGRVLWDGGGCVVYAPLTSSALCAEMMRRCTDIDKAREAEVWRLRNRSGRLETGR